MCRSIKQLRTERPASDEEVRAAALQFVRKVSGYREPSRKNAEAFERAVDEIRAASERLLKDLPPAAPKPRSPQADDVPAALSRS
jgi:hypothetical protein